MRRDMPDYGITEYVLCGLFIGAAIVCFLAAGHDAWALDEPWLALQSAGAGLLLLGGCVDPTAYLQDALTWPFSKAEPAGRDTWLTRLSAALGLALWLTGAAVNALA